VPRPKHEHPTPGELEILKVLWDRGPLTVRDMLEALNAAQSRQRAYTSIMSLMNIMTDKGFLARKPQGRAFVYSARVPRERTLGRIMKDLLGRAFAGSASALVAHLLDESNPTPEELAEIRRTVDAYKKQQSKETP
jgi:BlaI family penicillinase repressor